MEIITSTGIVLDSGSPAAKNLTEHALQKGLKNAVVYISRDPNNNNYQEYLLVINNKSKYASQSFEAIAAHIDILALYQQKE